MRSLFLLIFLFVWINLQALQSGLKKNAPSYFSEHDLCENEIEKAEYMLNIPDNLLRAIGTVESGRSANNHQKRAWPWTICANGKSMHFDNKNDAISALKKLKSKGMKNIDVGCMQINLAAHPNAFASLEEAFDPKANVTYASRFLLKLKQYYNSWTKAVAYYHSKTEKFYKKYCFSVYNTWNNFDKESYSNKIKINKNDTYNNHLNDDKKQLESYYSIIDNTISDKLHKLGKMSLSRRTPKFILKRD